jgi:hypothetical protein
VVADLVLAEEPSIDYSSVGSADEAASIDETITAGPRAGHDTTLDGQLLSRGGRGCDPGCRDRVRRGVVSQFDEFYRQLALRGSRHRVACRDERFRRRRVGPTLG